ncbi:hypothetical protein [Spirulina sp. 06S082]|uniref:DUF7219 family protein n=1 Tax=Spirulina sp. 06S082 TaxID=3110248 RepID=UPI002B218480|nr:hypothetical protein [Spirulina sp. 06S082]MEA5470630.1 hypothetical protein [Spirulina sp. 06S082]
MSDADQPNSSDADQPNSSDADRFLYPKSTYYGDFSPQNLVFNANLQEFAQRVNYLCNLETAGKLSSEEAYQKIKLLWKELKTSRKALEIGKDSADPKE